MDELLSKKIRNISFFCSIGVLFLHSYDPTYLSNDSHVVFLGKIEYFFSNALLGHFCVSLFFVISGYLFTFGIKAKDDYQTKLKRRVSSLLYPYLFWTLLHYTFFLLLAFVPMISSTMSNGTELSIREFWFAVSAQKYASHMWYVRNLMIYFLIVPILLLFYRNRIITIIFFCIMFALIILGYNFSPFLLNRFIVFALGAYLGTGVYNKKLICSNKIISFACVLAFIAFPIFICIFNNAIIDDLGYIFMPIFGWYAFDMFSFSLSTKITKYGFFIYCAHRVIIECFKHLFKNLLHGSVLAMGISYIASPLLTLIIVIIVAQVLEKHVPKFYKFVNGNR